MYLIDIENIFIEKGLNDINVQHFKKVFALYADDIVIFAGIKTNSLVLIGVLLIMCCRCLSFLLIDIISYCMRVMLKESM